MSDLSRRWATTPPAFWVQGKKQHKARFAGNEHVPVASKEKVLTPLLIVGSGTDYLVPRRLIAHIESARNVTEFPIDLPSKFGQALLQGGQPLAVIPHELANSTRHFRLRRFLIVRTKSSK
jgi:hypothetical protein